MAVASLWTSAKDRRRLEKRNEPERRMESWRAAKANETKERKGECKRQMSNKKLVFNI